jgi:CDP-glucose 4,6-dehydratase
MNAEKAVSMTMDWYSEFNNNLVTIDSYTESQIIDFINA